jgi:hypothetical protein
MCLVSVQQQHQHNLIHVRRFSEKMSQGFGWLRKEYVCLSSVQLSYVSCDMAELWVERVMCVIGHDSPAGAHGSLDSLGTEGGVRCCGYLLRLGDDDEPVDLFPVISTDDSVFIEIVTKIRRPQVSM